MKAARTIRKGGAGLPELVEEGVSQRLQRRTPPDRRVLQQGRHLAAQPNMHHSTFPQRSGIATTGS